MLLPTLKHIKAAILAYLIPLRDLHVFPHHLGNHIFKRDARSPSQFRMGFSRIAQQRFHFRGTEIARVDPHENISRFDAAGNLSSGGFF